MHKYKIHFIFWIVYSFSLSYSFVGGKNPKEMTAYQVFWYTFWAIIGLPVWLHVVGVMMLTVKSEDFIE